MCVLYVSFGSTVRPRTFVCVAMRSAVLFIFRSRLVLYPAGSEVNRVQVVLSGFSMRLFCFIQAKTVCRYGCMYFFAALILVCVDVMVVCLQCIWAVSQSGVQTKILIQIGYFTKFFTAARYFTVRRVSTMVA